jgi:anti-sigma-K factor RskA
MPERPLDPDQPGNAPADAELEELRALAARAGIGAGEPAPRLLAPPDELWDRIAAAMGGTIAPSEDEARPVAPVTELGARTRRRRAGLLAAAAAAAAVLVVAVGVLLVRIDDEQVVASATLAQLGPAGSGSAELVGDGTDLRLRIETTGLQAGAEFFEVWMIDTAVQRLVSLGPLREDGVYVVPPGLDPREFPVVDISAEPLDGDPAHSGASVLRGELRFI